MWDKTQGCEFFDGHYYQSKSDFPDLGSWEPTCGDNDRRRSYQGLSADIGKLPKYADLLTGSSAYSLARVSTEQKGPGARQRSGAF